MLRLVFAVVTSALVATPATSVRFDLSDPSAGPFPSDAYTTADAAQKTGRRVNLPLPDCTLQPTTCGELNLINQLDGFSVNPRLRVSFSAPIDPATLAAGVVMVALDNLTQDEPGIHKTGDVIRINQVIYDSATNTAYAKPDAVLDQHRAYALVITDAVKDKTGAPVTADAAYNACAQGAGDGVCTALAAALPALAAKAGPGAIVAASLFTTLSATAWLEKARSLLDAVPPSPALLQPVSTVQVANLSSITLNQQTGVQPIKLSTFTIPIDPTLLSGLGSVTMGTFTSPRFLDDAQTIAPWPTGGDLALPAATNQVYFNALLPDASKPKPSAGYPVVIFGHGFGDSRFGGPTAIAPAMNSSGFAVIAINAVGHGFGPESTVTFVDKSGNPTKVPAGGRSVDLNGDGAIEGNEGCGVTLPVSLGLRDCFRQTVVDLLQLVRAIRGGIDLDGDGTPDLDAGHIYYAGESLGAIYGTILNALEPAVRAAALNVGGGSIVDIARWSPSYVGDTTNALAARTPSLLNQGKVWNEDYVLRDQPAKTITLPGAIDIQNYFERIEWLAAAGDPLTFAPHLKPSPLNCAAARPVLVQMARGDRTVPNPASSALIRAAGLQQNTWLYRHDRARALDPSLPVNPHPYLVLFLSLDGDTIKLPGASGLLISLLTQQQIVRFFTADGASIPDPNFLPSAAPLFEIPAKLPEDFGY